MEHITNVRFKFEEKAGVQLSRMISKTDPWAGRDCEREACLQCETRLETGQGKGQDCSKRNVLYETWCDQCRKEDEAIAVEKGKDPEGIPLYKYLGESARSGYERGREHQDDRRLCDTGSHMLKHLLDKHRDEDFAKVKFRMKILRYHRSALIARSTRVLQSRQKIRNTIF